MSNNLQGFTSIIRGVNNFKSNLKFLLLIIIYFRCLLVNPYKCKDLNRKIVTMYQSLLKVEQVCYNVKVRGTEAVKWQSLIDKIPDEERNQDEGYSKY